MQSYSERFKKRADIPIQFRRQWNQVARRHIDELAKKSGFRRRTVELNVFADIVPARAAELAVIAVESRLEHSPVALGPASDTKSGFENLPGGFVAENDRQRRRSFGDATVFVIMQVGSTNSDGT